LLVCLRVDTKEVPLICNLQTLWNMKFIQIVFKMCFCLTEHTLRVNYTAQCVTAVQNDVCRFVWQSLKIRKYYLGNIQRLNVKLGGIYCNQCVLEGSVVNFRDQSLFRLYNCVCKSGLLHMHAYIHTPEHLIYTCKILEFERSSLEQQITAGRESWPTTNSELIATHIDAFSRFVKSIDFNKLL
jgi:hypothetical protein